MNSYNEGSCFECAADVDIENYDYIGSAKVWVCSSHKCHRALQRANSEEYEMECSDALEEVAFRWGH